MIDACCMVYGLDPTPYALHLTPFALHPTPYTLRPTPFTLHPTPCTLRPSPYTVHLSPCTLHPTPYALHLTPFTLHPTPYALHLTPVTLHPTPYIPHPTLYALHPSGCDSWYTRKGCVVSSGACRMIRRVTWMTCLMHLGSTLLGGVTVLEGLGFTVLSSGTPGFGWAPALGRPP